MKFGLVLYNLANQLLTPHKSVVVKTKFGFLVEYPKERINSEQKAMAFRNKVYEPETSKFLSEHLRKDDVCVDVGAAYGYFSCMFLHYGARYVYAIEPNRKIRNTLKGNLARNGTAWEVVPKAASDVKTTRKLWLTHDTTSNSLSKFHPTLFNKRVVGSQEVSTDLLDGIVRHERVDVIKIDVEGHELEVLKGAERIILQKPRILIIECLNDGLAWHHKTDSLGDYSCQKCDKNMIFWR